MKKIYTILFAVASLAFVLTSCNKEVVHQPGEADVDGCYGVYFPSQDESLTLDPSDPTTATIKVVRANTSGAITVPYTLTGDTDIITASDIAFADGQSETTCTLTFNSAVVGISYTCHFVITDEKYASKYKSQPIAFDYTVMPGIRRQFGRRFVYHRQSRKICCRYGRIHHILLLWVQRRRLSF